MHCVLGQAVDKFGESLQKYGEEQLFLALEIEVQGALAHVRLGGYVAQEHLVEGSFAEELGRRVDDAQPLVVVRA